MKVTYILILTFVLTFNTTISQTISGNESSPFPLKTMTRYCQKIPEIPLSKTVLTYDKENRLIKSSEYRDTTETYRTVSNYNELGLLMSKDFYSFTKDEPKLDRTRIYKYDDKNRLIYEGYDDEKGNNTKNNYTYNENGKLISSTNECNYNHWECLYEYDTNGKLNKEYKNNELEVSYEYYDNRLTKETHYQHNNFVADKNKEIIYYYDEKGLLTMKREDENIIEKNTYSNGKLVERWTYYFGIDPCFSPCCGQYITKYEYL